MNRVEELIQQLCPNGVEWKKLGEVCDYEQPAKYIVKSTNYNPQFQTPVLTAGQSFVLGYTDEAYGIYKANTQHPVIIFDDFTTSFQWVDFDFKVKSSAIKILIPSCESVLLRFVYYLMRTIHFEAVEHTRYWISRYSQIEIPIPPLPIQQEIVRILDTFTELTANLQTELDTRKKQYAYYRDCLLSFESVKGIEWKKLGEVCDFIGGGTPSKNIKQFYEGDIRWATVSDMNSSLIEDTLFHITKDAVEKSSTKIIKADTVIISTHVGVGKVCIIKYDTAINQDLKAVIPVIEMNNKYLFYWFQSKADYLLSKARGGTVQGISLGFVKNMDIPIPPLPEQRRIVAILDKFETLVNDLSVGLPAELDARRKQYEYYRDKLLTFDRV